MQKSPAEGKVHVSDFEKLETPETGTGEPGGYRLSPDDPLGREDEPVLGRRPREAQAPRPRTPRNGSMPLLRRCPCPQEKEKTAPLPDLGSRKRPLEPTDGGGTERERQV